MNSKYKIIYSPQATEDLRSIYLYIATILKAKATATNQVNVIRRAVRSLQSLPERFAILDYEPWASMNLHKLPVNNYIVFYLVNKEAGTVKIVRIFYGGRDINNVLQDS